MTDPTLQVYLVYPLQDISNTIKYMCIHCIPCSNYLPYEEARFNIEKR